MAVPISNVTRRVVYAASGTGPYAFTFEILANTDIAVYKDDTLLTLTTDYTVTIASNGTGSITLVAAPTGATQIAIVGNRTIQRTTDFVTGGDFFANTVNDEMDQQTIFAQQNAEGLQRALQAPQTDPTTINMTLPRATLRANKVLSFDSTGNPNATEFIGSNRGNWTSGTLYYVRDIIKDTSNNNIYQCLTQHTASGSQPISTNTDSGKWALLVDAASAAAAQAAAEAAQAAAETAETNAETAEANAETAETNAETAATAAASSASAASTSASNASSSASTASTAATNAGNSATAAATSATNASNSASAASTSASNASSSASAASTSASNASTSATNAASSATAASGSASTASTQATNAASSASAAATSATNASSSASAAASSASDASTSASAAAASFDSFDDRYLGAKSSVPSVDNDGNALLTGALYFDSTADEMRVYDGSAWKAAGSAVNGTSKRETFTATASQTSFTITGGYDAGFADVYMNGVKLVNGVDVTVSSGTAVVLATGAAAGDIIDVVAYGAFEVANALPLTGGTMSGQITFAAGQAFPGAGDVTLDGVETLSNKTLVTPNITTGFTVAGAAGTSGQVLTSAGSGAAPTWSTPSAGAMTLISTTTASNVATVNIEGLTSTYDVYVLIGVNLTTPSDQNIAVRMKYNGAYLTTGYSSQGIYNSGNSVSAASSGSTEFPELTFLEGGATTRGNFEMQIFNPASVSTTNILMTRSNLGVTTYSFGQRIGIARNTSSTALNFALTGIRIFGQGGDNFSGTFRLYGISNS